MPNQLHLQKSLYLRQHADNPVDWLPWGAEAFARAKKEDKPILVSIGYAACHWCHVMAHESFEDESIAKLMNTHFVCIKVDREEHPEVDSVYMEAVQMMNGQGGWPLNVFCLPDGRPFAGGTYFPPDETRGHALVPWPQLLMRVADYFQRQREDLTENATAVLGNLRAGNAPHKATGEALHPEDVLKAAAKLLASQDKDYGGFGSEPKFPPAMALDFLLVLRGTAAVEEGDTALGREIDQCINRTLTAMAHGGIYDQFGGGFSRYSVDRHWLIPHFEKMLYDNALLIGCYSRGWQRYNKPLYKAVVEETLDWLQRELQLPDGSFAAALDADAKGGEGSTYTWTPEEVEQVIGKEAAAQICEAYGISETGNFEATGRCQPALLEPDAGIRASLKDYRRQLLASRNQRPQPARDDKALTAWNALLLSNLAQAAFTFQRKDWMEIAATLAQWLSGTMTSENGTLYPVAYEGTPQGKGILDDYTYTAEAFLRYAGLVAPLLGEDPVPWIDRSAALIEQVATRFKDDTSVGFYLTSESHAHVIHRKKDWFDNAQPSGNAALIHAISLHSAMTGESTFLPLLESMKTAYPGLAEAAPMAVAYALHGFSAHLVGQAVIHYRPGSDLSELHAVLTTIPHRSIALLPQSEPPLPASFQLCVGTQCLEATDDAKAFAALI